MKTKCNRDGASHKKRNSDRGALNKAKNRMRIMNYLLVRAEYKIDSMIMDGLPGPREFESLGYDIDALHVVWGKHLAWLKEIGLEGVGPEDQTKVHDCFDKKDEEFDDEGGSHFAEILEA